MSVEDLIIHFQYGDYDEAWRQTKQFYVPGEDMKGVVSLHLRNQLSVRGLTIHLLGTATVSWESHNKKKVYQSSEVHLEAAKILLDVEPGNPVDLPRGVHQFSFTFPLPLDIPSTFCGVYGQVTYLAKVKMESEDDRNTTITSEPFMVLRRPELAPELYKEVNLKKSRFFLGLSSGKVRMKVKIDKSAAVPGDNIIVDGEVANFTGKGITLIQASIILESRYYAEGHEIVFRQYMSKRDDVYDVNLMRGRRWRHVLLPVPPYLPETGLEYCDIMSVKYFFQYKVRIEGKEDIVLETPLVVGHHSPKFGPPGSDLLLGKMWQGLSALDGDPSARDAPWYGGKSVYTESINGDVFSDMQS